MPNKPKLWTFVVVKDCLFIKTGDEVKQCHGAVLDVRTVKDKPDHIKVKCLKADKPRCLSLEAMDCDNPEVRLFRGCGLADGLLKIWKKSFLPHINQLTGAYTGANSVVRQRSTSSPSVSLLPVPKRARIDESSNEDKGMYNETQMDGAMKDYFLGYYLLPVSALVEPPDELLVRVKSDVFIESLKKEMMENATRDVQPLLCLVRLKDEEDFEEKLKDAYVYDTIGGNNSREAMQQLLSEHADLRKTKNYSHRLCSVYRKMPTELALRLASKHNRAAGFTHEMSTWDKIYQCRRLLLELSSTPKGKEIPGKKPMTWKRACAAILTQSVDQLDDGMVFFLASLPNDSFSLLEEIYVKFGEGELKSQTIPRSKKGTAAKRLDLKGSQLKCLRGMEVTEVHRLLSEVNDQEISFKEMSSECVAIKNMQKVQVAFVQGTNCADWEEAVKKYPKHTTAEQLEPYRKLDYSGKTLPALFLNFCQRASAEDTQVHAYTEDQCETDDSFFILHQTFYSIFWRMDFKLVTPDKFMLMLKNVSPAFQSISFPGFSLCFLDLMDGHEWTANDAKLILLVFRALNFHVNKQDFTVIILCPLHSLRAFGEAVNISNDSLQYGVCNFDETNDKCGTSHQLRETACGLVVVRSGNPPSIPAHQSNCFLFKKDPLVLNEADRKPLFPFQKPTQFFTEMVLLYTTEGEWILNVFSGFGSAALGSLQKNRHCVEVEKDSVLFIESKMRLVSALSKIRHDPVVVEIDTQDQENSPSSID